MKKYWKHYLTFILAAFIIATVPYVSVKAKARLPYDRPAIQRIRENRKTEDMIKGQLNLQG